MYIYLFIAVLIVLEGIIPYHKAAFSRSGFSSDFFWYMLLQPLVLYVGLLQYVRQFSLSHQFNLIGHYPMVVQFIITLLVMEFIAYWVHRYWHGSNFLWRFHELHHSSTQVSSLSDFREHVFEVVPTVSISFLVYFLLGTSLEIIIIYELINSMHSVWKHSNVKIRIGALQYLIISSEMHRCHHLSELKYQKSNYGNLLSLYDWIFGTAYYPAEKEYKDIPYGTNSEYPQTFLKQNIYVFRSNK